ncbi:hypothetical protein BKA64DRAFT_682201 [Cadophora sp. MPI-SDFR-AT-0126]|nr:hypothetical protein BKA64DRAFT_682201 [Leotiomycetes sp. MPI-SDFR-AT-0126]
MYQRLHTIPAIHSLIIIILLTLLLSTAASAICTRSTLLATAQTYISAQTSGTPTTLSSSLSPTNFTYVVNNKAADIKTGILGQPLKIDFSRSTADTVACASYTLLISSTGNKPYVIATQIRHAGGNGNGTGTEIEMIDSIVATTGDLFFDAKKTLGYLKAENWTELDLGKRSSREELKRVGDAYLDMCESCFSYCRLPMPVSTSKSVASLLGHLTTVTRPLILSLTSIPGTDPKAADSIPWGTDCERVEGSKYSKPCGTQLPHGGSAKRNGNRRYVIDEVVGSVDVLCSFDSLGDMPDSHEIRLEAGKVKYVHTVTVT